MKKISKTFLLAAALLTGISLTAKEKIRIAPGASCYVWNANTKSKPNTVPNGGFVDEATGFFAKNIHQCEELKSIGGRCFIMWEGYLQVPKTQDYRFTLTIPNGFDENRSNLKIFLNGKQLIARNLDEAKTMSASASMKRGFVKLRVYYNPEAGLGASFILKFAGINAMKMTPITPATLYHQVEDEN